MNLHTSLSICRACSTYNYKVSEKDLCQDAGKDQTPGKDDKECAQLMVDTILGLNQKLFHSHFNWAVNCSAIKEFICHPGYVRQSKEPVIHSKLLLSYSQKFLDSQLEYP